VSDKTGIEWTDHSFNPWWGCSRVSPACRFCYADRDATRYGHHLWRRHGERRMLSEANWARPLKWNRAAERAGVPAKVFCASMADVFEDHPGVVEARERLWGVVEATPWLRWQILTKRPENVARMAPWDKRWPGHVWLGTSVESQRFANERIPFLLRSGAKTLFLSCEPLLGAVDLRSIPYQGDALYYVDALIGRYRLGAAYEWGTDCSFGLAGLGRIGWVIAGGESGPKARPSHPDWFRSLRDQCAAARVPFLFKQHGEWGPAPWRVDREPGEPDGDYKARAEAGCATHSYPAWADRYGHKPLEADHKPWSLERTAIPTGQAAIRRWGKRAAGRELDGRTWDEFPSLTEMTGARR
jgi:protein gp37